MQGISKIKNSFEDISGFLTFFSEKKLAGVYLSVIYVLILLPAGIILHKTGSYYITSENDFFSSYIPHAESLKNGKFIIDVYRGPLYVLLLTAVNFIFNNYMTSGVIISAVSAGFFLYLTHCCLKKIFSKKIAFVAILLTSINPFFIAYSYAPGTDMLFNSFAAAAVYFFFISGKDKTYFILTGLFAALAFLTRYNAIFLLISIPGIIIFTTIAGKKLTGKITAAALFTAAFILVVSPWGIYTYFEKGEIFYNENHRNLAISIGNAGKINWEKEWNENSDKYDSTVEIIEKEPDLFAKTVALNFVHHSYKNLMVLNTLHVGIFSFLGLLFLRKRKISSQQSAYYIINLTFFIILLPFFYDSRFPLFLIPLFTLLACYGIWIVADYSEISRNVILTGLLCFGIISAVNFNKPLITGQTEVKETAKMFFSKYDESKNKKIIASRMPHIAYELNMKWIPLPSGKRIDETLADLRKKKVEYLYFSRREYNERKELRSLINPVRAANGLTPVVYYPEGPAVLYKIIQANTKK